MSQTTIKGIPKLVIRNKPGTEGKISTGANTQISLDGVPLRGARFYKIECKANGLAKVLLEMFAEVDAEVYVNLQESEPRKKGFKSTKGKHYAVYSVGSLAPVLLAESDEENS